MRLIEKNKSISVIMKNYKRMNKYKVTAKQSRLKLALE